MEAPEKPGTLKVIDDLHKRANDETVNPKDREDARRYAEELAAKNPNMREAYQNSLARFERDFAPRRERLQTLLKELGLN